MECLIIYISSERENNIIYEELVKAADKLKAFGKKKPKTILKSLSLKPANDSHGSFCDSEAHHCTHDWEGQIPTLGWEFKMKSSEEFYCNDYFRLAAELHVICDEEITIAKTNVQLIWCVDKYAPPMSEVTEFYGAIDRLRVWYNCTFSVVTKKESTVADWIGVFPFEIAKTSDKIITAAVNTLWTGQIALKFKDRNSLTNIGDVCLQTNGCSSLPAKVNSLSDSYILPVAELFYDVDMSSIPWPCIIQGSICQLKSPSNEDEIIKKLFTKISNRRGAGCLLRIRYSDTPPTMTYPESLTTSCFMQAVADGQFFIQPSLEFKGYHQVQVFLLTPEGSTPQQINAIGLQEMSSCGEDVMKLALNESASDKVDAIDPEERRRIEEQVKGLLKETPELAPVHMSALSRLLVQLPVNLRKCLEKNGQNVDDLWSETKEELEYVTNSEIFNHIFMTRPPNYVLRSPNTVMEPEIAAPKESWPEYQALKGRKETDLNTSATSQNILSSRPVIPEGAPSSFKADQLLKFFSKNGSPSENVNEKMTKFSPKGKTRFTRTFQQSNAAKSTNWPDSLHSSYHGIHYNLGKEHEKFDETCSEMKNQFVVAETNSTFSTQNNDSASGWKKNKSVRRSAVEGDQTSSGSGSSYYTSSQLPASLRRSPRKKVRQDTERSMLKASDLLKLETNGTEECKRTRTPMTNTSCPEISELHIKKLRNAVLTALEESQVTVDSFIFKSCFKKLFAICKPFVSDLIGQGSTTRNMEKIAKSYVSHVIEFEEAKRK